MAKVYIVQLSDNTLKDSFVVAGGTNANCLAVQPQIRKKNNSKTQDERRQDMRVTLGYNLCNPEQAVGPSEALLENMAAKTTLTATFNGSAEDVLIVPFSGRGFKLTGESYTVAQGEGSQMYNVRLQYLSRSTWADVDWD